MLFGNKLIAKGMVALTPLKGTLGVPATGKRYYPRPQLTERLVESLTDGNNILISSPRRVGKTSLLMNLCQRQSQNMVFVFVNVEPIRVPEDFYRGLTHQIQEALYPQAAGLQLKSKRTNLIRKAMQERNTMANPFLEFQEFLKNLPQRNKKLVLMVDEFPVAIENIRENSGEEAARIFLKQNRSLRIHPDLLEKVHFIYSGSICLSNTVEKLKASSDINDLMVMEVNPLSRKEAGHFTQSLLIAHKIQIGPQELNYLLNKVEWLTLYNLQLICSEIRKFFNTATGGWTEFPIIDQAFTALPGKSDTDHQHYLSRLSKGLNKKEIKFAKELLNGISKGYRYTRSMAFDIAVKFKIEDRFTSVMKMLMHDGYITNQTSDKSYKFNSPILKIWWKENVAL